MQTISGKPTLTEMFQHSQRRISSDTVNQFEDDFFKQLVDNILNICTTWVFYRVYVTKVHFSSLVRSSNGIKASICLRRPPIAVRNRWRLFSQIHYHHLALGISYLGARTDVCLTNPTDFEHISRICLFVLFLINPFCYLSQRLVSIASKTTDTFIKS